MRATRTQSRQNQDRIRTPSGHNQDIIKTPSGRHQDGIRTPSRRDQRTCNARSRQVRSDEARVLGTARGEAGESPSEASKYGRGGVGGCTAPPETAPPKRTRASSGVASSGSMRVVRPSRRQANAARRCAVGSTPHASTCVRKCGCDGSVGAGGLRPPFDPRQRAFFRSSSKWQTTWGVAAYTCSSAAPIRSQSGDDCNHEAIRR